MASIWPIVVALIGLLLAPVVLRWKDYEDLGLAPKGGGFVKDMSAFLLTSIPGWIRAWKWKAPASMGADLEGFHDTLEFNNFGTMKKFKDSPYFAENFYFWFNSPQALDHIFTIRLSFYGVGASHVIPWFHFAIDGDVWDLPEEFEKRTMPYKSGDPRVAEAPGLGKLAFDCVEPMRKWTIRYDGMLRNLKKNEERRNVTASFTIYLNENNVFMYQIHWDPLTAARSMAGKEWTAKFWENVRNQNQERYASQAEEVVGYFQFEGEEKRELTMDGSRDHNFGIRNWSFILCYIWFPPVKFKDPIEIEGVKYSYLTGAMTEYGNTFDNMVVGGLMSDDGGYASWSAATPIRDIAPEWYDSQPGLGNRVGERTVPGDLHWELAILKAKYVLEITQERGSSKGLWSHSFMLADDTFEIHEALTKWNFKLRRARDNQILQETTAFGLFEFGKNLIGYDDSV